MTLTSYQKMLMDSKLIVYTDHKNLTFKTFFVQRTLEWRHFVDQFDCEIKSIPGHKNILADCFSRLSQMEKPYTGVKELQGKGHIINFHNIKLPQDNEGILEGKTFLSEARQILIDALDFIRKKRRITKKHITSNCKNAYSTSHLWKSWTAP